MTNKKCCCKHSRELHSELGPYHWGRLNEELVGYKENSLKDRRGFWKRFLLNASARDWRCSKCECQEFRLDNLDYIEKLAKEKKLT